MKQNFAGVYRAVKKNKTVYYRASLTMRQKHISLGSHPTKEAAGQAYAEAKALIKNNSLGPKDYPADCVLPFEKWVILINFRDNGLYFSTPIYMKNKYFIYYLSLSFSITFDIDDLFYYSSRKIMRRGGHLFVADYGMQFNILNRYGIRSYAVEGRDYRFVNGNSCDFRYENIEIINQYHGVEQVSKSFMTRYKAKLHIRSTYVIGTYDTEMEAAVAYNKAADVAKSNGIDRRFPVNYIVGLPATAYADLYSRIKISPRIYSLMPPEPS